MEANIVDMYEKINVLLKDKGVTKKIMCKHLGIPYNTYMSMSRRKSKNIALKTFQDIARYLDVSGDFLLGEHENTDIEYLSPGEDTVILSAEQTHMKKYRAIDERGRKNVDLILNSEYERAMQMKHEIGEELTPHSASSGRPLTPKERAGRLRAEADEIEKESQTSISSAKLASSPPDTTPTNTTSPESEASA